MDNGVSTAITSGNAVTINEAGTHNLSVTAKDLAGNTVTKELTIFMCMT